MPETADNPRAVMGGNDAPDYAKLETTRLEKEYAGYDNTYKSLEQQENELPAELPDDDAALKAGGIIKAARALDKRMEDTRAVEVEPHDRRRQAIHTFFKSRQEAIQPEEKRTRMIRPGMIDRLQAKIDARQAKKEAEERARLEAERKKREEEERKSREEEERKIAEAAAADRAAREKQEAADRARSEEGRRKKQEEADAAAEEANRKSAAAAAATVKADTASETHRDAHVGSLARSSEVVKTQGKTADGGGVTLTKATEKYAFVVDRALIDDASKLLLFGHFNDVELDKAVRSFATATRHAQTLPGCEIGTRKKGVTR